MTQLSDKCACKDCNCRADDSYKNEGKSYCSDACANGHVDGNGCGHGCGCHG
jgi:hypothetical protein